MELTNQQLEAIDKIKSWIETKPLQQEFRLSGYAGTGKTTVIKHLIDNEQRKYSFTVAAFTGKAVDVLGKKGIRNASTIHSLIYNVNVSSGGKFEFILKDELETVPSVIIIDEASMISTKLYEDLKSFNIKLLFVGDSAQLEPIGDNPNLMKQPDYTLSEIHRQAKESSIIKFATEVRETGGLNTKLSDENLIIQNKPSLDPNELLYFNQVICAKNQTRIFWNNRMRSKMTFRKNSIEMGDKLIVLRNNIRFFVFNGMILFVKAISKEDNFCWTCTLEDETKRILKDIPIWKYPFSNPIFPEAKIPSEYVYTDFGYVITIHKSQGSEWNNLCVIDESLFNCDIKRLRYTAITRAEKKLTYCI